LLQIPADEILSRHEPEIALKILLDHPGRRTKRWAALAAMTFAYDEEQISFGEFLDALDHAPETGTLILAVSCGTAWPARSFGELTTAAGQGVRRAPGSRFPGQPPTT
jgi:hypothetical protein